MSMSKEEYLKKYTDQPKKKKKRIPKSQKYAGLRIVEDDIDFGAIKTKELAVADEERLLYPDDAPQVELIDDRPLIKQDAAKWRAFQPTELKEPSQNRKRHDSDASPPRQRHDSDASPPRKRHDSDASPTRKRHDSVASPPRKRHDSDASPPRKRHDSDASPPQKCHDSDASPPRNRHDSDASPPRKRHDSEASPPRNRHDSDASPPRKRQDSDESPPRPTSKSKTAVTQHSKDDPAPSKPKLTARPPQKLDSRTGVGASKMSKTLAGRRAGLSAVAELRRELEEEKRRKNAEIDRADPSLTGKGAQTVLRGKLRKQEAEDPEAERAAAERAARVAERHSVWGKGSTQVQAHESRLEDDLHEMNKPLARYKDDSDLDQMLKERIRDDDPMAAYMRKKSAQKGGGGGGGSVMPRYTGPSPAPNRFGIAPGYRWDGVDRSSGFEKKYFETLSQKKALTDEAYKWSTEDM